MKDVLERILELGEQQDLPKKDVITLAYLGYKKINAKHGNSVDNAYKVYSGLIEPEEHYKAMEMKDELLFRFVRRYLW